MNSNNKYTIKRILTQASTLNGKSFSELGIRLSNNKGRIGNQIENYFGLKNNNSKLPDFHQKGLDLELKTTPIRKNKHGYVAKERLVLSMINFNEHFPNKFESSLLYKKIKNVLIINYLHDKEMKFAKSWILQITKREMEIIQKDYEYLIKMIKEGKAHQLSEKDTIFLGATRKGNSNDKLVDYKHSIIPAKRRAWSFKITYMNHKIREIYGENQNISNHFLKPNDVMIYLNKYLNYSLAEINHFLNRENTNDKSQHAHTINALLKKNGWSKKILEKNNILIKCQKLNQKGFLQEALSFKTIDLEDLLNWNFEQTEIYNYLITGFIHVIFNNNYVLKKIKYVEFSSNQIEKAKRGFEKLKNQIRNKSNSFLKSSDDMLIHVRPKARNRFDTTKYFDRRITKMCLWINKKEIE